MQHHTAPPTRRFLRALLGLITTLALVATACSADPTAENGAASGDGSTGSGIGSESAQSPAALGGASGASGAVTVAFQGNEVGQENETEILIELGEGAGGEPEQLERETTLDGTSLDDATTRELLDRLPDLEAEVDDRQDFARPPATRPRPQVGDTVDQSFPPNVDGPPTSTPDAGPLDVVRFQPSGAVDLAPFISVTFNQPMVPVGTVGQVEQSNVPITITPAMPGRWIWLGTRTVRFEYEPGAIDRIPAATNYVVEVPAGTVSATGAELAETVSFEFSTPAASVRSVSGFSPSMATDPIFFVTFDQRVDPNAVLEVTSLTANGEPVEVRQLNGEEIAADDQLMDRIERQLVDRFMVIRPVTELPTDTAIELSIGPGVPSIEGPETSDEVFRESGRTFGPLRLVDTDCGFGDCTPGSPFQFEFSNRIDAERVTPELVQASPEIPGMQVTAFGNQLNVFGRTNGRETYEVTISGDLADQFGQTLGDPITATFRVGDAPSALFQPGRSLVTLDPIVDDGRLIVTTINNDQLDVTTYRVDPRNDWQTFVNDAWRLTEDSLEWDAPWDQIDARTVDVGGQDNAFTDVAIDLNADLADGHAVLLVEPTRRRPDDFRNRPFVIWVQRTDLGVDAITDNNEAVVWVTDLRTGDAVRNASIELIGSGNTDTTDANGVGRVDLGRDNQGLVVETDDDVALIGQFRANSAERRDDIRFYVIDDRGIYKPGETVSLKGWVRTSDAEVPSDLSLPEAAEVAWMAFDAFGNEIGEGLIPRSPLGGFDLEIELPEDITLGFSTVEFSTAGGRHWHQINVAEFRTPDFEVNAEITTAEPRFAGDTLDISATAAFFAGGPISGSPIEWQVNGSPSTYSPPNWADFTFGIFVPWWLDFGRDLASDAEFGGGGGFGAQTSEFWSSTTDETGAHDLAVTVTTANKPRPVTITAAATVFDVNRQAITGRTSSLIHPAELYVGLRGPRSFVRADESIDVDVIVTDLDGELVAGTEVTVTSTRLEWRFEGGRWNEVPVADGVCELTSGADPQTCSFAPSAGGRYRLSATITDDAGRANLTELTRWVAGGTQPQSRRVDLEQLTIIPDGASWQPGETATLLVQSPFVDAHGLAVITRAGITSTQTFNYDDDGSAQVSIPITEDDIGGIGVQIETAGTAARTTGGDTPRPAFAAGRITLPVPADQRSLTIDVAPRMARLTPGSDTQIDVVVRGPDGQPVSDAELAVIVVDEAVLSLTNYELADPLAAFYPDNRNRTTQFRGRSTLVLGNAEAGIDDESAVEGGDEEASLDFAEAAADDAGVAAQSRALTTTAQAQPEQPAIDLRSDFRPLAVFEPEVVTDAQGRATVDVPLPDNLTRYRVMVVATADATFAGAGESNITARLPITVRPTPPRFANFGDRFEFPVVVQNAGDEPLDIDVAFRSTNLNVEDRAGTTVTVPANDRVEVRFEVSADQAGTARYQVVATAGEFADAAEGSFPVYTPATAEAFATYGVVDSGVIAQPFARPDDVFPQFGGLEITTSSTALSTLTDAVIFLSEYRFESSDALAGRIIAIVSLDDVLEAFESETLPSADELRKVLNGDIDRLATLQNNDGGFPYWRRGRESIPFNSVQATHALLLAQNEGLQVPQNTLDNALFYLQDIESRMPSYYSPAVRRAISAYAVHVRHLAGDTDVAKARQIFEDSNGEQLDVAAWLWPVLAGTEFDSEIETLLNNRVTETANSATFATSYGEQDWVLLHSDRRTDAIVLDALIEMRPESDLVLKTLNGILAARSRSGRWANVQENSWVLLAGADFFAEFENVDPDFVARVWLGDTYAAETEYVGRSTDFNVTLVPMSVVVDGAAESDIVIERDGSDGQLYYRVGLRSAPTDFELEPRDQGFVVERRYEAIDDPDDVVQNDDGSWTVKAGARVRVRLTMVADSRRTHVALIDPLPAGLEPLNAALATTEPIPGADPSDDANRGFWWFRWFDHQNLRDDRVEAFATWLGAGSYEYTYVARATTPGEFVVPPTRAEMLYEPEVFGRTSNTTVTVVD